MKDQIALVIGSILASSHLACAPRVDPAAERKALIAADARFAREVAERGTEAWVSWFAKDGEMLPDGKPLIHGSEQIRAAMASLGDPRTSPGPLKLTWAPARAIVSGDGTLGYTIGNYVAATPRGERRGKYLTVWRKEEDGWKAVADLGEEGELGPVPDAR